MRWGEWEKGREGNCCWYENEKILIKEKEKGDLVLRLEAYCRGASCELLFMASRTYRSILGRTLDRYNQNRPSEFTVESNIHRVRKIGVARMDQVINHYMC